MNQFRFNILAATVIAGAGLAFLTLPASAQSVTKTCSTQYQAAKEAGTLKGQKWQARAGNHRRGEYIETKLVHRDLPCDSVRVSPGDAPCAPVGNAAMRPSL